MGRAGLPSGVDLLGLSLVGVPAGILAEALLSRSRLLATPLTWVGRRTLPVYVLHMPALALLHHSPVRLPDSAPVVALYPLAATALAVAGSLGAHALLLRAGLGALFAMPTRSHAGPAWRFARIPRTGKAHPSGPRATAYAEAA